MELDRNEIVDLLREQGKNEHVQKALEAGSLGVSLRSCRRVESDACPTSKLTLPAWVAYRVELADDPDPARGRHLGAVGSGRRPQRQPLRLDWKR